MLSPKGHDATAGSCATQKMAGTAARRQCVARGRFGIRVLLWWASRVHTDFWFDLTTENEFVRLFMAHKANAGTPRPSKRPRSRNLLSTKKHCRPAGPLRSGVWASILPFAFADWGDRPPNLLLASRCGKGDGAMRGRPWGEPPGGPLHSGPWGT